MGTLASLGENGLEVQRLMMEELGLGVPPIAWHTARDGVAEFVAVLGMIAATAGKVANEIATLQRTEVGEVEEPFEMGKVGSSTMPHKQNPMICEAVIAAARLARNNVAAALEAMEQEHERDMGVWQAEWAIIPETCILVDGALLQTSRVLQGLKVNPERMARNLELLRGLAMSEALMLHLARRVGRQTAHELVYRACVYRACMRAVETGRSLKEEALADPELGGYLEEDLDALLDPASYTGLAPQFVERGTRRRNRDATFPRKDQR